MSILCSGKFNVHRYLSPTLTFGDIHLLPACMNTVTESGTSQRASTTNHTTLWLTLFWIFYIINNCCTLKQCGSTNMIISNCVFGIKGKKGTYFSSVPQPPCLWFRTTQFRSFPYMNLASKHIAMRFGSWWTPCCK